MIKLLEKQPSEVYRCKMVEELKQNKYNKNELENALTNTFGKLTLHCLKVRHEVHHQKKQFMIFKVFCCSVDVLQKRYI